MEYVLSMKEDGVMLQLCMGANLIIVWKQAYELKVVKHAIKFKSSSYLMTGRSPLSFCESLFVSCHNILP
jgi:hypothetical protein